MSRVFSILGYALLVFAFKGEACPFASGQKGGVEFVEKKIKKLPVNTRGARLHMTLAKGKNLKETCALLASEDTYFEQQHKLLSEVKVSFTSSQKKGIKKLKKCLKILGKETKQKKKENYQTFLNHLRFASSTLDQNSNPDPISRDLVQKLCYVHFQVSLSTGKGGYDDFMQMLPGEYKEMSPGHFNMRHFNKQVAYEIYPVTSPSFLLGHLNRKVRKGLFFMNWDPSMHSMRTKIASFQHHGNEVSILRMGCPIVGANIASKIDPVFLSYLNYLKKEGKKHLYFNNQNTQNARWEKRGSLLLSQLAQKKEYASTFYLVDLPYDSDFYKQHNLGRVHAQQFIRVFVDHMMKSDEGFRLPKSLLSQKGSTFYFTSLLEHIHTTIFEAKPFLEQTERTQFIDIAYAYLARDLIQEINPQFVNWTCKHGIDRAMTSLAVFDGVLRKERGEDLSLKDTLYITYWPALTYYHRPPHSKRVVRAFSALKKLSEVDFPATLTSKDSTLSF